MEDDKYIEDFRMWPNYLSTTKKDSHVAPAKIDRSQIIAARIEDYDGSIPNFTTKRGSWVHKFGFLK